MITQDILYAAARIAGVLKGPLQTLSPDDASEAMMCFNSMVDSWKIQRLTVWAILRNVFTVTPNQQNYTLGPSGADFTMERPPRIESASWFSGDVEVPMRTFTDQEWNVFSPKTTTSEFATAYHYKPTVANGTLQLWPIPTSAHQIALYTWQTLGTANRIDDPLVLPPGYQRALELCLALELAMRYPDNTMTSMAVQQAHNAFAWIKSMNQPELRMAVESALLGVGSRGSSRYDIFSNRYL